MRNAFIIKHLKAVTLFMKCHYLPVHLTAIMPNVTDGSIIA